MHTMRCLPLFLVALVLIATGAPARAEQGSQEDPAKPALNGLQFDLCPSAKANATFDINSSTPLFTTFESKSGSGRYAYDSDLCGRYVVDVNIAPNTFAPHQTLHLYGYAYDLPSSAAFGGTVPATPQDCGRWSQYVTFYRKLQGEASFTKLGGATWNGQWVNGECKPTLASGDLGVLEVFTNPASGSDTYRIAVGTKLRTTFQEVIVQLVKYHIVP
jgi:hypothetical protein